MARYRFNEKEPIPATVIDHYIRHLAMLVDVEPDLPSQLFIEMSPLLSSISDVNDLCIWSETRPELVDDLPDEFVLPTRRDGQGDAFFDPQRDLLHLAPLRILILQSAVRLQIGGKQFRPLIRLVGT